LDTEKFWRPMAATVAILAFTSILVSAGHSNLSYNVSTKEDNNTSSYVSPEESRETQIMKAVSNICHDDELKSKKAWEKYIADNPIPKDFRLNSDTSKESTEESTEESVEDSSETSLNEESSEEPLEDSSEESLEELSEETSEESWCETSGALERTSYEQFMFEAVLYSECGAQGTSDTIIRANAWIARNKIEQSISSGSSDPFREALNKYHYQCVYDDELGWRVICPEGQVDQDLIDSNPDIHRIAEEVLNSTSDVSPIYDWDCTVCFDYFGFSDGDSFAAECGINQYVVIENGLYFPSSEWTERLTWYMENG